MLSNHGCIELGQMEFALKLLTSKYSIMKFILLPLLLTFLSVNSQIVINEINYNDAIGFETQDWVELYNNSTSSVDISNWTFKDSDETHEFIIPSGTTMPSNSYLVLAQTLADFQIFFPTVSPVLGDFTFGLSGFGELIRLYDNDGNLMDQVAYDEIAPWPTGPNGNGPTLELISPNLDNILATSWNSSVLPNGEHGTPGDENSSFILGVGDFTSKISSIYPNPLKTESEIIVSTSLYPVTLKIYDVYGKEVQKLSSNTNKFIVNKGNLSSGMYMLVLQTEQGAVLQEQKLMVN